MSLKQKTLNAPISFQGKGLHTGLNVTMTINPAEPGHGIKFRRTDKSSSRRRCPMLSIVMGCTKMCSA